MTYADELHVILGPAIDAFIEGKIATAIKPKDAEIDRLKAALAAATKPPVVIPPVDPKWGLIWEEDFTSLDASVWTADSFTTFGDGNGHIAVNTSGSRNLVYDPKGGVSLIAQKETTPLKAGYPYSAAHLHSKGKKSFVFGKTPIRFEVRAKWAMGPGLLPCPLWLRPAAGGDGEIDLVESITKDPLQVVQTVHQSYSVDPKQYPGQVRLATPFTEYHVYAVEIDANGIQFYIDGVKSFWLSAKTATRYAELFGTDREWIMHMTQAVGGTWVGSPTAATKFPAPLTVEYIRVYRRA